jgi:hypothetical protein
MQVRFLSYSPARPLLHVRHMPEAFDLSGLLGRLRSYDYEDGGLKFCGSQWHRGRKREVAVSMPAEQVAGKSTGVAISAGIQAPLGWQQVGCLSPIFFCCLSSLIWDRLLLGMNQILMNFTLFRDLPSTACNVFVLMSSNTLVCSLNCMYRVSHVLYYKYLYLFLMYAKQRLYILNAIKKHRRINALD